MSSSNVQSMQQHTMLKDIRPMMRKLDIKVIVLHQEGEPVILRDGCIIKFMVADVSGVMLLNVWGSTGEVIRSGDILRITEVESKYRSGQHYLATSRRGKIQRIGQDTLPFAEGPNFSEPEPGANIPPSRAARAAIAIGSGVNQTPLQSKQQQQQQPYTDNGLQPPLQPSAGQHHYRQHRNHGDGWRGDGGKGRFMGRKGGNDDPRRLPSALSSGEGMTTNQRDPRKRNLDNSVPSASVMTNEDSRSIRQKVSYNEFAP